MLAALASAEDLAEVERVMKNDITSGVRANSELMAEITDADKEALEDRIDAAATPGSASRAGHDCARQAGCDLAGRRADDQ